MKFRNLVAAAAAVTMSATSAFAADVSRAAEPVTEAASQMGGDSTMLLILAVLLMGAGIFVLADNNDDTPTSP